MTQPIRPTGPGASTGLDALSESTGQSPSSGPDAVRGGAGSAASATGSTSSSEAGRVATAEGAAAQGAASAQASGGAGRVLADLQSGLIDRDQAIEALVSRALAEPHVARLSAAKQAELAGVLRAALREDPQLAKLVSG